MKKTLGMYLVAAATVLTMVACQTKKATEETPASSNISENGLVVSSSATLNGVGLNMSLSNFKMSWTTSMQGTLTINGTNFGISQYLSPNSTTTWIKPNTTATGFMASYFVATNTQPNTFYIQAFAYNTNQVTKDYTGTLVLSPTAEVRILGIKVQLDNSANVYRVVRAFEDSTTFQNMQINSYTAASAMMTRLDN